MRFGVAGSDAPVQHDAVVAPPGEAPEGRARCATCRLPVPAGARFCPDCGVRLTPTTAGSEVAAGPPVE